MICITLTGYVRPCAPTTGGISAVWMFDPSDFDFTPGVSVSSYSTVLRRTGATFVGGAVMAPIPFLFEEGQLKGTQKQTGCSMSWDFDLTMSLPGLSQAVTDFMNQIGTAACCCGLGLIIQMNDGTIFVLGERYVSGNAIPRWIMKMDGATLDSGKAFTDYNGVILSLKGSYLRAPNTFTGGISVITGFTTA